MNKAQISMAYMIIVGFVTVITIPLIIIFSTHSTEMNEEMTSNQANSIATKIVDSAESVYYIGDTSKITFRVQIPNKVEDILIGDHEVTFLIRKHNGIDHVVKYCSVPINGSISKTSGIHNIVVESMGDYVWVSN